MSMQCFVATDKKLNTKKFYYKDILPTIKPGDMFYNEYFALDKNLTVQEQTAVGHTFSDFIVYAVRSAFGLCYEPRYKKELSEDYAINALEELKWFKRLIKSTLASNDLFMVINLHLGMSFDFDKMISKVVDVNDWNLSETDTTEFGYGLLYKFVDNSFGGLKQGKAE